MSCKITDVLNEQKRESMEANIYCVIMAGGKGNRLWPLSQTMIPKQFLDLVGVGKTILQMTYERFRTICSPEHFVVVTNESYLSLVKAQLPELPEKNILCEPFRRNTSACIAYANAFIKQQDKDAITIVTPSDHLILNESLFVESVKTAASYAEKNQSLVTIGVKAYKPETAFGYIQIGDSIGKEYPMLNKVKTFTEKPNAEMAQVFYECGDFCWNTGVFVWSVAAIEREMTKYLPNVQSQFDILDALPVSHWTREAVERAYEECENISIDYGVMEKARNVYVQQTDAAWSDLGSWDALYEQGRKDKKGNAVLSGKAIIQKSEECLVHVDANRFCILEGLKDYMVVERGDVLIICPKSSGNSSWKYAADIKLKLTESSN